MLHANMWLKHIVEKKSSVLGPFPLLTASRKTYSVMSQLHRIFFIVFWHDKMFVSNWFQEYFVRIQHRSKIIKETESGSFVHHWIWWRTREGQMWILVGIHVWYLLPRDSIWGTNGLKKDFHLDNFFNVWWLLELPNFWLKIWKR